MEQNPPKPGGDKSAKPAGGRDDRLKAALRANLQRRKAQARARDTAEPQEREPNSPRGDNEKEN